MSVHCPGCLRRVDQEDLLKAESAGEDDSMDVRDLLLLSCLFLALEGGLRPRADACWEAAGPYSSDPRKPSKQEDVGHS